MDMQIPRIYCSRVSSKGKKRHGRFHPSKFISVQPANKKSRKQTPKLKNIPSFSNIHIFKLSFLRFYLFVFRERGKEVESVR